MRNHVLQGVNRALLAAGVILTAGAMLVSCASADVDSLPTQGTGQGDSEPGLVIDGVEIADSATWTAAQSEGTLTLYTAQPESTVTPIVEAFMQATDINVDVVRLSGGPLEERVMSEIAGGQLAADVIQASDLQFAALMKDEDALEKYEVPWVDDLRKDLVDPDGMYTPWSTAVLSLAYNTAVVDAADVPTSWADLLDPKWKGKIGIFDIGTGGSAWAVALFQRQVVGDDYWTKLASQEPLVYSGNAPLAEALERGEISVGYAGPSLILRAKDKGAPIDVLFPKEGFPAFVSFLTLPKTAAHPNAAKVYLNWATSAPGETAISAISGDYMSNTKVPAPTVLGVTLPEGGPWVPSSTDWLDLRDSWSREYRELFGAAQPK